MELQLGQKIKLTDLNINNNLLISFSLNNSFNLDFTCFGVSEDNKLNDDRYMVFYNQPNSPDNEIKITIESNKSLFNIDLNKLPPTINKLVFTTSIDSNNSMKELNQLNVNINSAQFKMTGNNFKDEKAIIICEVYKKYNIWRLGVVGQGFNGGLDALLTYFGGVIAESDNTQPKNTITPVEPKIDLKKKVFLEKRISLEKRLDSSSPQLLSLSKKAAISLEKRGLGDHMAKVALCLDISGSMDNLYRSGIIQKFVERVLALACRLDDDGSIDVFLFGAKGYKVDSLEVKDFKDYIPRMLKRVRLEADTSYSSAIELVRKHYATPYKHDRTEPLKTDIPTYVMFLTDGRPSDKKETSKMLRNASYEPIFWQFMGVGGADFEYLESLDTLEDRYIDNANFFEVKDLSKISDDQLFEKLTSEYPSWINLANNKGLLE